MQDTKNCEYHDEESFKYLLETTNTDDNFLILSLNIRSIIDKYEDLLTYLNWRGHKFSGFG